MCVDGGCGRGGSGGVGGGCAGSCVDGTREGEGRGRHTQRTHGQRDLDTESAQKKTV